MVCWQFQTHGSLYEQAKNHDSALPEKKQEGPGQVVRYHKETSVPPGDHDRGGRSVLTGDGDVARPRASTCT